MRQLKVEFTKNGVAFAGDQVEEVVDAAPKLTDLYVVSHGWNNSAREADLLYDELFTRILGVQQDAPVPGIAGRTFGVARLYWPSRRFEDPQFVPGGGAASTNASHNEAALVEALTQLAVTPERLGGTEVDPDVSTTVHEAMGLIGALEQDPGARKEFVELVRSLVDRGEADLDDGTCDFLNAEPETLFNDLRQPVVAPGAGTNGGARTLGAGGAAGLCDVFANAHAAARRLANFVTYYQMKARAGLVGRRGVHELLCRTRAAAPNVRLHLIGHSFGGRVVTAAANCLKPKSGDISMTLLQAAYSHNGLGEKFDKHNDGAFRKIVSQTRVSGPIVITHTKNDFAVGIAYPLASRIAAQKASFLGDGNDPCGGMGRNGAQHTPEAENLEMNGLGKGYIFSRNKVYNLRADKFITGHSAVTGDEVAYAILHAVASLIKFRA